MGTSHMWLHIAGGCFGFVWLWSGTAAMRSGISGWQATPSKEKVEAGLIVLRRVVLVVGGTGSARRNHLTLLAFLLTPNTHTHTHTHTLPLPPPQGHRHPHYKKKEGPGAAGTATGTASGTAVEAGDVEAWEFEDTPEDRLEGRPGGQEAAEQQTGAAGEGRWQGAAAKDGARQASLRAHQPLGGRRQQA